MRDGIYLHQLGAFMKVPSLRIVTYPDRAKNMPDKTADFLIGRRTIEYRAVCQLLSTRYRRMKEKHATFNYQ